ncbi:hypothetical protein DFP72DRAFT_1073844 [Ephemerocybe angulata]|uniref:F-box domain-containing protein n=1 Tax=Ephemerocybe angulata TaxID=980116 RepID=A0A8H6M210_9AGAR|nr:hypothetical protein DFP72DRAFT_1073844 [Tulosesus angulatus]
MPVLSLPMEVQSEIVKLLIYPHDVASLALTTSQLGGIARDILWMYHVNNVSALIHLLPHDAYTRNRVGLGSSGTLIQYKDSRMITEDDLIKLKAVCGRMRAISLQDSRIPTTISPVLLNHIRSLGPITPNIRSISTFGCSSRLPISDLLSSFIASTLKKASLSITTSSELSAASKALMGTNLTTLHLDGTDFLPTNIHTLTTLEKTLRSLINLTHIHLVIGETVGDVFIHPLHWLPHLHTLSITLTSRVYASRINSVDGIDSRAFPALVEVILKASPNDISEYILEAFELRGKVKKLILVPLRRCTDQEECMVYLRHMLTVVDLTQTSSCALRSVEVHDMYATTPILPTGMEKPYRHLGGAVKVYHTNGMEHWRLAGKSGLKWDEIEDWDHIGWFGD